MMPMREQSSPRRWQAPLVAVMMLMAFPLSGLWAAEFITPQGLNIPAQEADLKEKINTHAKELVGKYLLDVQVQIRYIRTDPQGARRVKLPGFNGYISPQAGGEAQVIPGHTRLRQVLVMVDKAMDSQPKAVEDELLAMGNFDPAKGDLVRVISLDKGKGGPRTAGDAAEAKEDLKGEAEEEAPVKARPIKRRPRPANQREPTFEDDIAEVESTTFLVKARKSYFGGDYDKALGQILQSIEQNPENPQAFSMLGSLYYAMGWKSLAVKYWEKSLELDSDNRELTDLVVRMRREQNL